MAWTENTHSQFEYYEPRELADLLVQMVEEELSILASPIFLQLHLLEHFAKAP